MSEKKVFELIDELEKNKTLSDEGFLFLLGKLKDADEEIEKYLYSKADKVRRKTYGTDIYLRGLIELTNHCKNDCYYCGIRRSNLKVSRYRLTTEEVLESCKTGYSLGYRTFVLQGGEDAWYSDKKICELIRVIKKQYPDCAITLSIGEKSYDSYKAYFEAGADRYLLRQESSNPDHYRKLHPKELSGEYRKNCLYQLKEIGYQVGCGIMVGSPGQTDRHILEDLRFMQDLKPHMIGIGPFIPAAGTPMQDQAAGTLEDTLHLLSILRLMFPHVLLPATTALGTIHPFGRESGIQAGANVIMPNISPMQAKDKYLLYDGKLGTSDKAGEAKQSLESRMKNIGYRVIVSRGDYLG